MTISSLDLNFYRNDLPSQTDLPAEWQSQLEVHLDISEDKISVRIQELLDPSFVIMRRTSGRHRALSDPNVLKDIQVKCLEAMQKAHLKTEDLTFQMMDYPESSQHPLGLIEWTENQRQFLVPRENWGVVEEVIHVDSYQQPLPLDLRQQEPRVERRIGVEPEYLLVAERDFYCKYDCCCCMCFAPCLFFLGRPGTNVSEILRNRNISCFRRSMLVGPIMINTTARGVAFFGSMALFPLGAINRIGNFFAELCCFCSVQENPPARLCCRKWGKLKEKTLEGIYGAVIAAPLSVVGTMSTNYVLKRPLTENHRNFFNQNLDVGQRGLYLGFVVYAVSLIIFFFNKY